jgi:hypothetical protein
MPLNHCSRAFAYPARKNAILKKNPRYAIDIRALRIYDPLSDVTLISQTRSDQVSQATVSTTVRFPESVRVAVEEAAKVERRSMNSFIVHVLEEKLKEQPKRKRKQPV